MIVPLSGEQKICDTSCALKTRSAISAKRCERLPDVPDATIFAPLPKPLINPADSSRSGEQHRHVNSYWTLLETALSNRTRKGIPIGELLVQQGVMTDRQVQHILTVQKASHRPFGDLAERLYGISPKLIEDAWVVQYVHTVGTADLDELDFDEQCLRMLNRRQAWQFHLLPVAHDEQMNLNMATDADNLVRAVNFSSRRIDESIHMLVAERDQLREFLLKHYPVPDFMAAYADKL